MRMVLISLIASLSISLLLPFSVGASLVGDSCSGVTDPDSPICASKDEDIGGGDGILKTIIDTLLMVVGFLAVIMIVFGGIKYMTSAGDSNKVVSAKNTLLYAAVGLIIAMLSFGIVQFVYSEVFKTDAQREIDDCKAAGKTWIPARGECR